MSVLVGALLDRRVFSCYCWFSSFIVVVVVVFGLVVVGVVAWAFSYCFYIISAKPLERGVGFGCDAAAATAFTIILGGDRWLFVAGITFYTTYIKLNYVFSY